jgi:hypothetical protein
MMPVKGLSGVVGLLTVFSGMSRHDLRKGPDGRLTTGQDSCENSASDRPASRVTLRAAQLCGAFSRILNGLFKFHSCNRRLRLRFISSKTKEEQ